MSGARAVDVVGSSTGPAPGRGIPFSTSPSSRSATPSTCRASSPECLPGVVAGYGGGVDLDLVRAWWAHRCLTAVPWPAEHGLGPPGTFPETAVLLRTGG